MTCYEHHKPNSIQHHCTRVATDTLKVDLENLSKQNQNWLDTTGWGNSWCVDHLSNCNTKISNLKLLLKIINLASQSLESLNQWSFMSTDGCTRVHLTFQSNRWFGLSRPFPYPKLNVSLKSSHLQAPTSWYLYLSFKKSLNRENSFGLHLLSMQWNFNSHKIAFSFAVPPLCFSIFQLSLYYRRVLFFNTSTSDYRFVPGGKKKFWKKSQG